MIPHVLRLAMGEWYKLRLRWIPWILLGIIILLTQVMVWVNYISYHRGNDSAEPAGPQPRLLKARAREAR